MEISEDRHPGTLRAGDRVRVRRQPWIVASVEPHGPYTVLSLSAASPEQEARTLTVIAPFDDVRVGTPADRPQRVGRGAWRRACRALIAADGAAGRFRVAPAADIDLLAYQLEPALALLHGRGCRLLLADDVGLGKTVQAVLALAELRASGDVQRALVLCPAGLRDQWIHEARVRVGVDLTLFDQDAMRRARRDLPPEVNPWSVPDAVVASIDYVKRPEVLPLVLRAPWDVVIVDEAHGTAGATDRHDAAAAICARAAYVLLLTATPHNGDEEAFRALAGTGAHGDPLLVFRRTRDDAGLATRRRIHTLVVRPSSAERAMHAALDALAEAVRRERQGGAPLLLALLYKRACSGPFALAESVQRRMALLDAEPGADADGEQLLLPLAGDGEGDTADTAPMWREPALRDRERERRLLQALLCAARVAEGADSKERRLRRLLARVREPVIVFTEYRDTLLHLQRRVAPGASIVHGGLTREERHTALETFPHTGLLLATDAAGEGLNLHAHCRLVVSLELPWNPMRLEQRIGRVDRIGQARRVHAVHLVSAAGEVRLLDRLAARVSRASARIAAPRPLGAPPPWSETSAAAIVMGLEVPGGQPAAPPIRPMPLARFEDDARDACRQIRDARAMRRRCAPSEPSVTPDEQAARLLVSSSRHATTRARTGGRTIALFRTDLHDGTGRLVATRVTAVLAELSGPPAGIAQVLQGIAPALRDKGHDAWLSVSLDRQRRRARVVQRRLRAIAAWHAASGAPLQAGLFDRRAERRRADDERLQAEWRAWIERRLADSDAGASLVAGAPRLVLLLGTGTVRA